MECNVPFEVLQLDEVTIVEVTIVNGGKEMIVKLQKRDNKVVKGGGGGVTRNGGIQDFANLNGGIRDLAKIWGGNRDLRPSAGAGFLATGGIGI